MENSRETLSRILLQSRVVLNKKQNAMAKMFDIESSDLCKYEKGEKVPHGDRLIEMLEVLAVNKIDLNTMFQERIFSKNRSS